MDRIIVRGNGALSGTIPISGAKNAALPLMIASMLTSETLTLRNMPRLADVDSLKAILANHGVDTLLKGKRAGESDMAGRSIEFRAKEIVDTTAPYELVRKMRASFWVVGPLLARCGVARVSLPGGCAIGTRPVDLFLDSLRALGTEIDVDAGYVNAKAPKGGLQGGTYTFPKVSVGATHVMLMAASLAKGTTVVENAAREPEVVDVADCLNKMGAQISGHGTSTITIEGVTSLHGATHSVLPDRIETGTFACCVAMTGGDVMLQGADGSLLRRALDVLEGTGTTVEESDEGIRIARNGNGLQPIDLTTDPFPGFPTDLQAQFMALAHPRRWREPCEGNDLRKPLHARAGTGAPRCQNLDRRPDGHRHRRATLIRRTGHGDRPARVHVARYRRAGSGRRNGSEPRLPPRPRFRETGGEIAGRWRADRAYQWRLGVSLNRTAFVGSNMASRHRSRGSSSTPSAADFDST